MPGIYPDTSYFDEWYEAPSSLSGRPPLKPADGTIKAAAIDRLRWPFVELTRFDPGFAILARPRRRASDRWAAELQPG